MEKKLLTPQELADLLGVPVSWVYDKTRLGQAGIPQIRLGKYVRFDADVVVRFFRDKRAADNRMSFTFAAFSRVPATI